MRLKKEKRDAEASQEKARDELARKQTEYFREADTLGAAYAKRLGIEQLALLPNRTFSWMFTYPMDHRYDVATCKYLNAHDVGKFTKCLNDFEDSFHDEERRATILREAHAHRDRSDVVAQVLNYTVTGYEDGDSDRFGDRFWFTEHPGSCVYRFSQPNNYNNGTALDLSKLDPKNLTITDDLQKPLFGGLESVTVVLHEGHELLRGTKQTDPERVRRGWDLIYSKYCHGMEKAF
jgi:hypothetical protein